MYKGIVILTFILSIFSINLYPQDIYQEYLNIYNIPIIIDYDDNDCYIDVDDSINSDDFRKFINFIFVKLEIIADNIVNIKTTRTVNGGPFKRKYISVVDGKIEIIEDHRIPEVLVYDPSHPDAIRSGLKKGYVEYPNIDIVTELVDFIATSRIFEVILLKGLGDQIINKNDYDQLYEQFNVILLNNEILYKVLINNNE